MDEYTEPWPRWATEAVEIVEPDPGWITQGEREARQLDALLAGWLTRPVEHVGSTAVAGLPAKPVIDLQAVVADFCCVDQLASALAGYGWHFVPAELDQRPWRRFFVRVRHDTRVAHLHLMIEGTGRWRDQLDFRDELRAHPGLVDEYAALKRELADRYSSDREAYTLHKAAFVRRALGQRSPTVTRMAPYSE